jgi:hypothetical protein
MTGLKNGKNFSGAKVFYIGQGRKSWFGKHNESISTMQENPENAKVLVGRIYFKNIEDF